MKRYISTLLLAALSVFVATAQEARYTISGTVADLSTGEMLPYVTVSLLSGEQILAAEYTDLGGEYTLKAKSSGDYTLRFTLVGYEEQSVDISVVELKSEIQRVALKQGISIDDVVVEVQKPIVTADAEKMTYSVEDDPEAATSTLEEVIRKVPQLSLDAEGKVLLNGKSDYKILLNGRPSASMSNNFADIIKSMPASQIKRIEVITNPSTKYDAEGVGGIINLITDRSKSFEGYNGSLMTGVNLLGPAQYMANAQATIQSERFAISAMGFYSNFESEMFSESHYEALRSGAQERYRNSKSYTPHTGDMYNFNIDMSYTIDTLNFVTFNTSLWRGKFRSVGVESSTESFDVNNQLLYDYKESSSSSNKHMWFSANASYEHIFKRAGHTLTISDEVGLSPTSSSSVTLFDESENFSSYSSIHDAENRSLSNTLQVDYVNPISFKHTFEAGLKHIYRDSKNDDEMLFIRDLVDGEQSPRLSLMEQSQNILALYFGYKYNSKMFSLSLGGRAEQTWNSSYIEEHDKKPYSFSSSFFNFVPYASLTMRPKDRHSLSLSYTQRLQRPGISWLSPAVNDSNPLALSYGNPDLEAAIYHNLNLQYSLFYPKWSLVAGLSSRLSNNCMTSYSFMQDDIIHTTYSNDVDSFYYGFNFALMYRPSSKFNLSASMQGGYYDMEFAPMSTYTERFSFSQNINMTISLWREAQLSIGEYYFSGEPQLGSWSPEGTLFCYASLKQSLLKKRLDLTLNISNPFRKYNEWVQRSETPTYVNLSSSKYNARSISFRVSWRFGKQSVRVKQTSRSINNDDVNRESSQTTTPGAMGSM